MEGRDPKQNETEVEGMKEDCENTLDFLPENKVKSLLRRKREGGSLMISGLDVFSFWLIISYFRYVWGSCLVRFSHS